MYCMLKDLLDFHAYSLPKAQWSPLCLYQGYRVGPLKSEVRAKWPTWPLYSGMYKTQHRPTCRCIIQVPGYDPVCDNAGVGGNAHVVDGDRCWIAVHADDFQSRIASVAVRDDAVLPRDPELTKLCAV